MGLTLTVISWTHSTSTRSVLLARKTTLILRSSFRGSDYSLMVDWGDEDVWRMQLNTAKVPSRLKVPGCTRSSPPPHQCPLLGDPPHSYVKIYDLFSCMPAPRGVVRVIESQHCVVLISPERNFRGTLIYTDASETTPTRFAEGWNRQNMNLVKRACIAYPIASLS